MGWMMLTLHTYILRTSMTVWNVCTSMSAHYITPRILITPFVVAVVGQVQWTGGETCKLQLWLCPTRFSPHSFDNYLARVDALMHCRVDLKSPKAPFPFLSYLTTNFPSLKSSSLSLSLSLTTPDISHSVKELALSISFHFIFMQKPPSPNCSRN